MSPNLEREKQISYNEAKALLQSYSSGKKRTRLNEKDTLVIEEAWWRVNCPGEERRYYVGNRPVQVVEEGYWYCPVRVTLERVQGEWGIYTEISGICIVKTPTEAIAEAKKIALCESMSSSRNLIKTEVLLSGRLKFPGQERPRWLPVQLITDGELQEFDRIAREAAKQLGYQIIDPPY